MAPNTISIKVPYIKTLHKKPYPVISPLRPELSQAGRTVVVIGASAGIGFAIARAFVQASASHVILTGRREAVLAKAVSQLQTEAKPGTAVSGFVSDSSDLQASEKLWSEFSKEGIAVDVLVLNAMATGERKPLLKGDLGATWKAFETNVRGLLDHAQRFDKQGGEKGKVGNYQTPSLQQRIEANGHPVPRQRFDQCHPQPHWREPRQSRLRLDQELGHAVVAGHGRRHGREGHANRQLPSRGRLVRVSSGRGV
jgi:NAD(P)-dependent dehydrogenase (short-subunit alcohol dehydrogenase family)